MARLNQGHFLRKVYNLFDTKLMPYRLKHTIQKTNTAGIIVIGDEILKGEVFDTNSHFMCKELHNFGVTVKKISVIGDKIDDIVNEVRVFVKKYNFVLTSGGIGPTHDDLTFEAVAKAFNEPLTLDPYLKSLCQQFYKTNDQNNPGMKLAKIPKSSKLNFLTESKYPLISKDNVYMFPGIPELLQKSFPKACLSIFKSDIVFYSIFVYINLSEPDIANVLNDIVKEFPLVQFGSYPKMSNEMYKVKITIESNIKDSTLEAYKRLYEKLPQDSIVKTEETF